MHFEGEGLVIVHGARVRVKIWREIGGKRWIVHQASASVVCHGAQFQALCPRGGDYSSVLRLAEVHTPLIPQKLPRKCDYRFMSIWRQ